MGAGREGLALDHGDLLRGIAREGIDRHQGRDAEPAGDIDGLGEIAAALLDQLRIGFRVDRIEGFSRHHRRTAAVHLEGADARHDHRGIRLQPRVTALDIDEFLQPDIGTEAGLGDHIVRKLEGDLVGEDR